MLQHIRVKGRQKGMLLVFNPTEEPITRTLDIPLYYTGLITTANIRDQDGPTKAYPLDRGFNVKLPVTVPANGYTWLVIE